jgi:protoheme IX farnesyltransferase
MGTLTTDRPATTIRVERSVAAAAPRVTYRRRIGAYVALTKPRIIGLLLITTVPAMILAEQGVPSLWLICATVLGGTLAAGGANAINCYLDRDIDAVMHRTQGRPLPMGIIDPASALVFALVLEVVAFTLLLLTSNLLAATLAVSATAFYVFVYTLWLKRSTPQNIVIGGAAGAFPPLVGWAAVTGDVSLAALVLFAIVFVWTPPHFWALALYRREDYRNAGLPMLPNTHGPELTRLHILLYTIVLVATTTLPYAIQMSGFAYLAAALALGAVFISYAWKLHRRYSDTLARATFRYSIVYLAALFTALLVDHYLR